MFGQKAAYFWFAVFDHGKEAPKKASLTSRSAVLKSPKAVSAATAVAASPVKKTSAKTAEKEPVKALAKKKTENRAIVAAEPKVELSPAFKALAEPVLPELKRENRARLMMQTPTELYFYWSVRENPYHLLKQAFGSDTGSYLLF